MLAGAASADVALNVMRLAISKEGSSRTWPYVLATSTPPSLWPTHPAMTLKSTPASMVLMTK